MTRNAGNFVENQFTQGLITETTGLNFPEKAVSTAWNVRFETKGNVVRRLGFDTETGVTSTPTTTLAGVQRTYYWNNPGRQDYDFLVIQSGRHILFASPDNSGNYTGNVKAFTIDLASYRASGAGLASDIRMNEAAFASAEGRLFVVHPMCDPIYVDYDPATDTIAVTQYEITIRDTEGIDDGLDDDTNPSTLSNLHKYNLYNQGWDTGVVSANYNESHPNAIDFFQTATLGKYPNNCQIWWSYKAANSNGIETLQYRQVAIVSFGNSRAPRGHYIYNAFNIDREGVSGIAGVPSEVSSKRPSAVAFFAGRIWYAGVDDKVYYSQVIENEETYGRCYQKNDPTAEQLNDLLDTDGGVIKILGIGNVSALYVSNNSIYIMSPNGIWTVSGSGNEGTAFVATDFAVRKISTIGVHNITSILDVEGAPIWWNLDGIWTFQNDQNGFNVKSLTENTIKSFLNNYVPVNNRPYVQGAYNPAKRTIQWLFRTSSATSVVDQYKYEGILELNLNTGAFYPFTWDSSVKFSTIAGLRNLKVTSFVSNAVTEDDGTAITTSTLDPVTISEVEDTSFTSSQYKYLYLAGDNVSFFEERREDYVDFKQYSTEKDYSSFFTSGAKVHGEGNKDGTIEYVTVFCKWLSDGSVKLQTKWDWSNSTDSGKWSIKQECYTSNRSNRDVSRKRLLIRGSGPAVQLHFTSVSGKPFDILGWSSYETVDATP